MMCNCGTISPADNCTSYNFDISNKEQNVWVQASHGALMAWVSKGVWTSRRREGKDGLPKPKERGKNEEGVSRSSPVSYVPTF
eukprot:410271-Pelagomonas_calceolata.AAC.1